MQAIQHYGFYALAFAIALGALVAFHEFGHFWVARRCGVKVLKFSIGFGPKLTGRQGGETEYVISAIPLGGYVKMLGEDLGDEVREADKQRSFAHAPLLMRTAIVAAGPVFNLLLAYLIFTAWLATGAPLFVPSFADLASNVEAVVPGSPAEAAGLRKGDKIVQIGDKRDRKSTRLNSSHGYISYAVFCLKKKTYKPQDRMSPNSVMRLSNAVRKPIIAHSESGEIQQAPNPAL